ncbi:TolC family protein [Brevibacillus borstelensis]|uniref:TolC family protein n=1 Tax=Brevibacillus borstelensis TaxID=45462 RepID=UPI0030BF768D
MKSTLFKRFYSTTLITALLSGSHIAMAAPPAAHAEQANAAKLTLDQAEEKALSSSVDLALLRLDADSTYYKTRQTLQEKSAIKSNSIKKLDQAKKKYEDMAKARKDLVLGEANMKAQENTLRLQVQKAYLELLYIEAQIDLQQQSIKRQFWSSSPGEATEKNVGDLKTSHKQALAKLNELLNENPAKEWKLAADDLTDYKLPPLEEIQQAAHEKRPDMVKARAEKEFAQARIDYLNDYSALSTYLGKIAKNDGIKADLVIQRTKEKADQEIAGNYQKAVTARQALEESSKSRKSGEKRYHEVLSNYRNGNAALSELIEQEGKLLEVETKHAECMYQYHTAVVTFKHSIGY